ncbi:hypothetical protein TNCV_2304051 [Trichonephila clavipes]|nr:hypothetical protein TNCV_2304051 [Trichonephila clavipes]
MLYIEFHGTYLLWKTELTQRVSSCKPTSRKKLHVGNGSHNSELQSNAEKMLASQFPNYHANEDIDNFILHLDGSLPHWWAYVSEITLMNISLSEGLDEAQIKTCHSPEGTQVS